MSKHPRGIWIWRLANISENYLNNLVQRNVKRVYLKVFDGVSVPKFWGFQCKEEIIKSFKDRKIEVYGWGYHYGTDDVAEQADAVNEAFALGIDGYILDVEKEVENPKTHKPLEDLLKELKKTFNNKNLGYTSFGNPDFHPKVPWKILDDNCDLSFPQIYFEKFRFKPTNEEEVQACLEAHKKLGLKKPILPIWGSESDTINPATAFELQQYLDRFDGSSVWRMPNKGERGEALKLDYSGNEIIEVGEVRLPSLPNLSRMLRRTVIGDDVKALQKALKARGLMFGEIDGDFGPITDKAVRSFQLQAGLTVDGEVGPDTWTALGGKFDVIRPEQGVLAKLADLAQIECSKQLSWKSDKSEAEKYLEPFREPMKKLGHLGNKKVFYNWCAAFVTWCCRESGIKIPDQPAGFWATMALVESWKYWAKKEGYWHPAEGFTPRRGDILVFEWFDGDVALDHIGFVRGYEPGSRTIQTSEGNSGNVSVNRTRDLKNVPGFIRIIE